MEEKESLVKVTKCSRDVKKVLVLMLEPCIATILEKSAQRL